MNRTPWMGLAMILLGAGLLAGGVTVPKLRQAALIRGWISGAEVAKGTVTDLWCDRAKDGGWKRHWVEWESPLGDGREVVEHDDYVTLKVDGPVDVVRLSGEKKTRLRIAVYATDGSVVIDAFFLALELAACGYAVVRMLLALRRKAQ